MRFSRKQNELILKKNLKKVFYSKKHFSSNSFKRQFIKKKFIYLGGIFLFSLGVLYFLFFSSFFNFKKIDFSKNSETIIPESISLDQVKQEVNIFLEKRSFLIFPKNNFFLFKEKTLEKELLKKNSQIEKIEVKKEFPSQLILKIEEKRPIAILFSEEKKFFLLEKNGMIFKEIFEKDLEFYKDLPLIKENFEMVFSKELVSPPVLAFIKGVYDEIPKKVKSANWQTKIISVSFLDSFYKISFKTSKGGEIYFSFFDKRSIEERIDLLKRFLEEKNLSLENVKYIDISVEDRIYYQ